MIDKSRIITLSNGKKVANFSSPHPFTFTDGTVLPAVSPEEAERLKVTFIEDVSDNGDVKLSFDLSEAIFISINQWIDLYSLQHAVDVVFCPLPMITVLNERWGNVLNTPFRAVRIEDRNQKLVSITKQCI
jgi:hypothetical protein